MAVVSSFPLLHLPRNNLKTVMQNMGAIQQVCISLLSNKIKKLISEFCTFKYITIRIGFSGFVRLEFSDDDTSNSYCCVLKNGTASVSKKIHQRAIVFPAPQFDARSWLNHFLCVLNPFKIESLSFEGSSGELDWSKIQMVKDCLKGIEIDTISTDLVIPMEQHIELISTFPPTISLHLGKVPRRSLDSFQLFALRQILSREYERILLSADYSLDDLLCTRCSSIVLYDSLLTEKDINMFLKHLAAGLKPELKVIGFIALRTAYNRNTILKGIPFEDTSAERKIRLSPKDTSMDAVDIQLGDGNKATITFKDAPVFTTILVSVYE